MTKYVVIVSLACRFTFDMLLSRTIYSIPVYKPTHTYIDVIFIRRDKPKYWVRIMTSVIFFICSVTFYHLCNPGESLEGQFRQGCAKFSNILFKKLHKK